MSFFATTDILSSLISGDLIKSIINNPGFKEGLDKIDVKEYFSDEVIEDITQKIFSNPEIKKQLRKIIVDIIFEMDGNGFHICCMNKINNGSQSSS